MTIVIEKRGKRHYRADCLERSGSPPVGLGRSKVGALAHLLFLMTAQSGDTITINGKPWRKPAGYTKR